ncbi:MAG: hypothetical protein JNM60_09580 [Candidatus Competibacteraceae bacterium]|nr:hypothetical protein [Candidatus Competibacteraceae bacterium]
MCVLFVAAGLGAALPAVTGAARAAQDAAAQPEKPIAAQGNWRCAFLRAKNDIEKSYYSWWGFDAANRELAILYSPVHKGFAYEYRWGQRELSINSYSDKRRENVKVFKAALEADGTLVIEDPSLSWGGWRCRQHPAIAWPTDSSKFLDYGFYPWLRGLVEDPMEIMKYRHPEEYRQWLEDSKP